MPGEQRPPEHEITARAESTHARVEANVSGESPIVRVDISLSPRGLRARIAEQQETTGPPKPPRQPGASSQKPRQRRPSAERIAELQRRRTQLEEEAAR